MRKLMLIVEPLPFVASFIDELNLAIKGYHPDKSLTRIQRGWLGLCITAILMTNTVCWKKFERASGILQNPVYTFYRI
jgi:hypothetical protein